MAQRFAVGFAETRSVFEGLEMYGHCVTIICFIEHIDNHCKRLFLIFMGEPRVFDFSSSNFLDDDGLKIGAIRNIYISA